MTRVGWLTDRPAYLGGAELSITELRAAAPEEVEIIDCPPGEVQRGLDRYVAHNVVGFEADDLRGIDAPLVWFHHDLSPHIDPAVKRWLDDHAAHVFCSPLQRDRYGMDGECVPPALGLDRYRPTRQIRRHRKGTCTIGQWRNRGKGALLICEWAAANGPVDVYGEGGFIPGGQGLSYKGRLDPGQVAATLHRYERFVFLPSAIEPFGRAVVEAWAAGCRLVVNRNVGALHWIENDPEALDTAAEDFWAQVAMKVAA